MKVEERFLTLKLLDPENHSVQFWNLQPKIRLLNQTRFATEILQAESLARALREQREVSTLRIVRLDSTSHAKPLIVCQLCGVPLVEQKTRPRRFCGACKKDYRKQYWKSRYSEKKTTGEPSDKVKLVKHK